MDDSGNGFGQSFVTTSEMKFAKAGILMSYSGIRPSSVTVSLIPDAGGKPGAVPAAQSVVPGTHIASTLDWVFFEFMNEPYLSNGSTYWLVLEADLPAGSEIHLGALIGDEYPAGELKSFSGADSSWSSIAGWDMRFRSYKCNTL